MRSKASPNWSSSSPCRLKPYRASKSPVSKHPTTLPRRRMRRTMATSANIHAIAPAASSTTPLVASSHQNKRVAVARISRAGWLTATARPPPAIRARPMIRPSPCTICRSLRLSVHHPGRNPKTSGSPGYAVNTDPNGPSKVTDIPAGYPSLAHISALADANLFRDVDFDSVFVVGRYLVEQDSGASILPINYHIRDHYGTRIGTLATALRLDWMDKYLETMTLNARKELATDASILRCQARVRPPSR